MGGHAFPALSTPRMPPQVYHRTKSRVLSLLATVFRHVAVPTEAPAKKDYGDIDVVVYQTLNDAALEGVTNLSEKECDVLAGLIGAADWKRLSGAGGGGGGGMVSFAVPWADEDEDDDGEGEDDSIHVSDPASTTTGTDTAQLPPSTTTLPFHPPTPTQQCQRHIQIDLHHLPTLPLYKWTLFHASHGDLWPILGSLLRRFGLTATPNGFFISIPALEGRNRSLARVKLTDDPGEVLRYLGLDEGVYWKDGGFVDWDGLCRYLAGMRFVDLGRAKKKKEEEGEHGQEGGKEGSGYTGTGTGTGTGGGTPPKKNATTLTADTTTTTTSASSDLNSSDRQRATKRPLFAYFHTTYISTHSSPTTQPSQPRRSSHLTKQETILDAKSFFGPDFAKRYDEAWQFGMRTVGEPALWTSVREMVKGEGAEGAELGYGVKGVKACVAGEGWAWVEKDGAEREMVGGENEVKGERVEREGEGQGEGEKEKDGGAESVASGVAVESGAEEKDWDIINNLKLDATPRREEEEGILTPEQILSLRNARVAFKSMHYDEVLDWARENWRLAGKIQRAVDEKNGREYLREKERREIERKEKGKVESERKEKNVPGEGGLRKGD